VIEEGLRNDLHVIQNKKKMAKFEHFRYKEQYFAQVYGGFICTYIFLQERL
jgi:hypothetical protein